MTKKEQQPKKNNIKREQFPDDLPYNPDITEENKKVLNNQSTEEKKDGNLKNRKKPIDYTGAGLDKPEMDNEQFNQTRNKPDDSERKKRSKRSANSQGLDAPSGETIYKGEKAKKYSDPSKSANSTSHKKRD